MPHKRRNYTGLIGAMAFGCRALGVALLLLAPGAHAALTNAVPFTDNFESYPHGTPLIDGTNGWYASDTNVMVQTNVFYPGGGGTRAAQISTDAFLTNRFDPAYTVNSNSLWVEMYLQPALLESAEPPVCDPGVAASFYLNSNGHFVARNADAWVTLTNTVFGGAYAVSSDWVRVNCRMDYNARKWWLFMDGVPMADNIAFADAAVDALSALDVYNGATTTYMDNVAVTVVQPAGLTNLTDLHVSITSLYRSARFGNNAASAVFDLWNAKAKVDGGYFEMRYTNTIDYGSGPSGWLNVAPAAGTVYGERAAITVTFNTVGLPVSATPYTATIRVAGVDASLGLPAQNSPREIVVELWIRSVPELWVDPLELRAEANWGGTAAPDELRVANAGTAPRDSMGYNLNVTTADGGAWLVVTPASGVSTGEVDALSVSYLSSTLAGGIYTGAIEVVSEGANGSPANVPVYLRVNHEPVPAWDLDVADPGLNANVQEGESVEDRYFHVWNDSAVPVGRMRYEVNLSDDLRAWVSAVTPAVGISSGEAHRLTVQYKTENMRAGVYGGVLTVRGVDDWSGKTVGELATNLTLRVVGRAALLVNTNRIYAQVLQNLTADSTMQVWNGAGEPRRGMRYQITAGPAWVGFAPASGVLQDGTATVSVAFNAGTLAPGGYAGEVVVDAWDVEDGMRAIGAPLVLPARLDVSSRTPVNYEPPEIIGTPYIGQYLEAWPGLWNDMNRLRFEFQWERASDPDGGGRMVARAWNASRQYQVGEADRGKYLRVTVRATDDTPTPLSATADSPWRQGKIRAMPGDFDGDGRTDLWFFNPVDANWHAALSAGGVGRVAFGAPGMAPVPGDYDGNGYLDLALYDRASGMWHAMLLPQWQYASGRFGWPDSVAVPGDYNGNGITDLGVYWAQGGRWYLYFVNEWRLEEFGFGGPGAVAVPGDYDGDGITDAAVYYASTGQWLVRGSDAGEWQQYLGGPDATPIPGDYDGDGKLDVAVYWPGSNLWQMRLSGSGVLRQEQFGVNNGHGIPLPGYYDRDGLFDPAHAHINGDFILWSVRLSSMTNYFPYRGQSYQISTDFWRVSW